MPRNRLQTEIQIYVISNNLMKSWTVEASSEFQWTGGAGKGQTA